MVCAPDIHRADIGNHYGLRTWIEYGLKQTKDTLGWADFRLTGYEQIEKWWEMVMRCLFQGQLVCRPMQRLLSSGPPAVCAPSVVDPPKRLETLTQQSALNHPTPDLFELDQTNQGFFQLFHCRWDLSN